MIQKFRPDGAYFLKFSIHSGSNSFFRSLQIFTQNVASSWDAPVSADASALWVKLCSDFASVAEYTVPRRTFSEEAPNELLAFCDASKQAYGFVVYAIQRGGASFFFSKVKVAPLSSRTLPTLELLAILLALNCLSKILTDANFCQTKNF